MKSMKTLKKQKQNIFNLWDSYSSGEMEAKELLKEISKIYHPPIRL